MPVTTVTTVMNELLQTSDIFRLQICKKPLLRCHVEAPDPRRRRVEKTHRRHLQKGLRLLKEPKG